MVANQKQKEEYQKLVDKISPNSQIVKNCARAFIVGGIICCIGQFINNIYLNLGYTLDETSKATSIILIIIAMTLTGLGVYDIIVKYAGAGASVPITGFANSMVSTAIEFKKEGYITGVGAKLFTIAGPVVVYGTITSVIVGLFHYAFRVVDLGLIR